MSKDEMSKLFWNWESEYRFHPVRRWRFDWVDAKKKVAVEYEGGIFRGKKSRHTNPIGYASDCEKYNAGQILGYTILRYNTLSTEDQIKNDLQAIGIKLNPKPVADVIHELLQEEEDAT